MLLKRAAAAGDSSFEYDAATHQLKLKAGQRASPINLSTSPQPVAEPLWVQGITEFGNISQGALNFMAVRV